MKRAIYILFISAGIMALASCEKRDYNHGGLPEYENHYYAAYLPNDNSGVSLTRTQTALIKFPVQFYSSFTRSYDAVANYAIVTTGIANPAVLGQDFNVVDKNGAVIQPANGKYSMTFVQSKRATDTIYIKLLNSNVAGTRKMEVQIQENKNDQYYVDIFSTAFRRSVEIK
jgi:hypothetical protein